MMHHRKPWPGVLLGLFTTALIVVPARAADVDKLDSSLKLVPAEAAFYTSSLRNREQFEIIAKSKAWAKLTSLPFAKTYWKQVQKDLAKPGGPLEMWESFQKDPQNQELLDLLCDMSSHEVFCYGDDTLIGSADLLTRVISTVRYGPALAQLRGQAGDMRPEELQGALLLKALNDNAELLRIPDFVIGFKLTKPERAEAQIKRLEELLKGPFNESAQLKGRLKRRPVAGKVFLVVTLDGSLVPWDEVKLPEQQPGDLDKLKKRLKAMTFTVSLGVRDNYLLVGIGADTKHLAKLGKGKALAERPEFKPLAKYADRHITETSYVSKALREKFGTTKKDIDEMSEYGKEALKKAGLPEDLQKRIAEDLDKLVKDLRAAIPETGASMTFSFLTETGQESFSYDWTESLAADGSKPLTLAQHLGGNPLLAGVSRTKYDPASYQKLVNWIKILYGYVDDFALPNLNEEQRKQYDDFTKLVFPILKRLDKATGKMVLPALADGQVGIVLDSKMTSKTVPLVGILIDPRNAPPAAKPLPMLEIGFLMGVSDAALLKKGFDEYREAINDAIAVANNKSGGQFPEVKIPPPLTRKLNDGTMYYYPIPELPGLDKRVLPNAGLSDSVLALTLSQAHSERLLSKKPLKTECPLLQQSLDRPLASMSYADWAGFVEAITPWVDYILLPSGDDAKAKQKESEAAIEQVHVVLEVLKCFRCAGTVSYFEDKAQVTHTQSVFRDLK
jgi:hypothetical protein